MEKVSSLSQNIRRLRHERNMSLEELGKACDVSRQTVQRYESGAITNIPAERIEAMAKALGTTPAHLQGWDMGNALGTFSKLQPVKAISFPMTDPHTPKEDRRTGKIFTGFSSSTEEVHPDFAFTVQDDSMKCVHPGDVVLIEETRLVDNGGLGLVAVGDDLYFRRIYQDPLENRIVLVAENKDYPLKVFLGEDRKRLRILGRAVAFQIAVRD